MRFRRTILLPILAASMTAGACRDPATAVNVAAVVRVDPRWVTGAAAAAVDADGRFVLPVPAKASPREIDEAEARAQAEGWAMSIARSESGTRADLEREHGGAIDFGTLRACGRAVHAAPAWGPVDEEAPAFEHNFAGPKWLVRLCAPDGEVPVVLAVAANSDLFWIEGQLRWPHGSGNWFRSMAVPRGGGSAGAVPMEPEAAVAIVFRATGRRISEVPAFVEAVVGSPPSPMVPQCGYWRVTLEAPIRARGGTTGATYETRDVRIWRERCVDGSERIEVAVAEQPAAGWPYRASYVAPDGTQGDSLAWTPVRIPYKFEPLVLPIPAP